MTPDPILTSLLRTILDPATDCDEVRLVYADALEERGEMERSEFIRVCMALEKAHPSPDCAIKASRLLNRYRKGAPVQMRGRTPAILLMREAILIEQHAHEWLGEALLHLRVQPIWRKGFVEEITLASAYWIETGDRIRAEQPVRRVRLTTLPVQHENWQYMEKRSGMEIWFTAEPERRFKAKELGISTRKIGDNSTTFARDRDILFRHRWPGVEFTFPS
jgi:uncharacterized protein (TIGR02996 family)